VDEERLTDLFGRFKAFAEQRKTVTEADLQALVTEEDQPAHDLFQLVDLQVSCGRPGMSTATVRLTTRDGEEHVAASVADGPVNAVFQAIDAILATPNTLVEYAVHGVTAGRDALGEVTVRLAPNGEDASTFGGYGADTDVIAASARAYLAALNQLVAASGATPAASATLLHRDAEPAAAPAATQAGGSR